MLKRYIIFTYHFRAKMGGWNDVLCEEGGTVVSSFDTVPEAQAVAKHELATDGSITNAQIVDLYTCQLVEELEEET